MVATNDESPATINIMDIQINGVNLNDRYEWRESNKMQRLDTDEKNCI